MCGRYVSPDEASIEREFNLVHAEWRFPANFNIAPSQPVPANRARGAHREGVLLRCGLVRAGEEAAAEALVAYPDEQMIAYPVDPRVNSAHNNDETLLDPLDTDVD